jgi:CDP-diacylglycerol--glycerol-3-phosphate 3-phosphatidyltransferase
MRLLGLLPQRLPRNFADPLGRGVARLGITANVVSIGGLLGNAGAAWLIVDDHLVAAGIVFAVFSALDMVDGAVARATGTASAFGAVFDAVLDRASEALVLAAIAWHFGERGENVQAAVTYAALFLDWLTPSVWVLAILSNLTALQRFAWLARALWGKPEAES